MQELGLIGLRIQRMPSEPDLEFGIPSKYSYMTVQSFFRSLLYHSILLCPCTQTLVAQSLIGDGLVIFLGSELR